MVKYRLRMMDHTRHLFEVTSVLEDPHVAERLRMPSWIPGSYLLREYARHVVSVSAHSSDAEPHIEKVDKSTWLLSEIGSDLSVTMRIFALDESVRGAFLDSRRAYFNGTCVFACPLNRENEPVELTIEPSPHAQHNGWKVATAMRAQSVDAAGFGTYVADSFDELVDHPVEIGVHSTVAFEAGGVPHRLVIAGRFETDLERVATDLRQLCETQIRFFGGSAPFDSYTFLGLAADTGAGGLEHRTSSSLIFARNTLPKIGESGIPSSYQRFLALASHEYFHAWHVKRTQPEAFVPFRLDSRNYTRQLWVFEGITTYYQDVFLLRSGLIGANAYLQRLSESLTRVYRTPGRAYQSIAESSFDAWDKLYKPHADSQNTTVSYYSKGALVALALDLKLRCDSDSRVSLDDVMLAAWRRYGLTRRGMPEDGFEALAEEITDADLSEFFDRAVRGVEDLPIAAALSAFAVEMVLRPSAGPDDRGGKPPRKPHSLSLGAAWQSSAEGVVLTSVDEGGALQRGGLRAGDRLIALDGLAVNWRSVYERLARYEETERIVATWFRGEELLSAEITLQLAPQDTCELSLRDSGDADALRRREAWLGV
jgi:predicted metalloprotease with PDZ domain